MKKLLVFFFISFLSYTLNAQTVTTTATFNNISIEVDFGAAPAAGTVIKTFVKKSTASAFAEAHPLSRVSTTKFAGSIVQVDSGTVYSVKLTSAAFADIGTSVTTRSDVFPDATGAVYHVATSGNDGNSGLSLAQAFKTIAKGVSVATANTKVLIHAGTYYEGDIAITNSGTPTAPIVIMNAPGESVIMNGTDPAFSPTWTVHDAGNNIYRYPSAATYEHSYIDGVHLPRYNLLSDLVAKTWGEPSAGSYCTGATIYVRFPQGTAPAAHTVKIPQYTSAFDITSASYIQIKGLEICYYGGTSIDSFPKGIYIDTGSYNLIEGCNFHQTNLAVVWKRSSNFNTVQNCTVDESNKHLMSWESVKTGGVAAYEAGGVCIYDSPSSSSGNVIRNNVFKNMFDGCDLTSGTGGVKNTDFYNNTLGPCGDDGVEADGKTQNVRYYGNTFKDFLTGISTAPAEGGPSYIFRNYMYNKEGSTWHSNNTGGFNSYPFKFNHGYAQTIDWVYLYHNTYYTDIANSPGFLFKNYSNWNNVISRNNIYTGTTYALENWSTTNPVDFDYDNLYTTGTVPVRWAGVNYSSLSAFYTATTQEQHGVSYSPGFVNIPGADYRIAASSMLVDRGVVIPGFNDGFYSAGPDIGAYEYGSTVIVVPGEELPKVKVYPNPVNFGTAQRNSVKLLNVLAGSTVKIFASTGELISSIAPGDTAYGNKNDGKGLAEWGGCNASGVTIPRGVYYYIVESDIGITSKGKIAVLK